MVRTLRGIIVVLAVALLGFVMAPASVAADNPAPSPTVNTTGCTDTGEYPAPCVLTVKVQTFCSEDVPTLTYNAVPEGTPNQTVTITFVNPSGPDLVFPDRPLSGTLTFPGVVVTGGKVVDWPGWTQNPDGTWVKGDQYNWVREGMVIHFKVNPEADATAMYPGATAACNPPNTEVLDSPDPTPSVTTVTQVLADPGQSASVLSATGSNDAPLLAAAIGFIVIGAGAVTFVAISRRRRSATQ